MKSASAQSVAGNISKSKCKCAGEFEVRLARADNYKEFKRVLDIGRHPTFIGRNCFGFNANNGGALLWIFNLEIVAVSLINPNKGILLAMNVHPDHRSHGLGSAMLQFLKPNFVRAIEDRVPWFVARGYRAIGKLKQGRSLKTQVLARDALFGLAGKLQAAFRQNSKTTERRDTEKTEWKSDREEQTQTGQKTNGSRISKRSQQFQPTR